MNECGKRTPNLNTQHSAPWSREKTEMRPQYMPTPRLGGMSDEKEDGNKSATGEAGNY